MRQLGCAAQHFTDGPLFADIACNAWDDTQKVWVETTLSEESTYTFIVRHEPLGTSGAPCEADSAAIIAAHPYTMTIVGHVHTF